MKYSILLILAIFNSNWILSQQDHSKYKIFENLALNVVSDDNSRLGTAFLVGYNDSHLFFVTARHVIEESEDIVLTSDFLHRIKATIIGKHDKYDLALLQTSLIPFELKNIPVTNNLSINDEVVFISMKDSGIILPKQGSGIVRNVNPESISVLMQDVDSGHSGSLLLHEQGIAGMILKKGNQTECLNIMLIKSVLEEWAYEKFQVLLMETDIRRSLFTAPGSLLKSDERPIHISKIKSTGKLVYHSEYLNDGNIATSWQAEGDTSDKSGFSLYFPQFTALTKFEFFIPEGLYSDVPKGKVEWEVENKLKKTKLQSILKFRKKEANGYWFTYVFKKSIFVDQLHFEFSHNDLFRKNIKINEIQVYGYTY